MRLAVAAFLLMLSGILPAQGAAVALVLAVDVSESVSSDRYALQREGIARAFEAPQLIDAIAGVPGGIQALVIEWSDPDKIAITVGWTRIANRNAATAFAESVRATTRTLERPDRDRLGDARRGDSVRPHAGAGDAQGHRRLRRRHGQFRRAADRRARCARPARHHDQRPGDPVRGAVARRLLS